MKVSELREILKKYNKEEIEKIVVQLYKKVPKKIKEENDIDGFITNLDLNAKVKKEVEVVKMEDLEKEVNYFLQCANNNLYCEPNKIIPKGERSKWRFKVKAFYKKLNSFDPLTEDGIKATELLRDLYKILSYGSTYLTFSNWNTFGAIQVPQGTFLNNIVHRKLLTGITEENIAFCVKMLTYEYDPQCWHEEVLAGFRGCLESKEAKELALELIEEQIQNLKEKIYGSNKYRQTEIINYSVKCAVQIYFDQEQIDEGISFFKKYYLESSEEIKEYILLEIIYKYEFYEAWIKEYEKNKKIKYRDSLKEQYKKIKAKIEK